MTAEVLRIIGQVAGIGGLALGVLLLLYRDVVRKNVFSKLTQQHSYRLLFLIVILVFLVAIIGLTSWVYVSTTHPRASSSGIPSSVRFQAYNSLLNTVDRNKTPALNDFLHLGKLAESAASDSEIQHLENRFGDLYHDHGGRESLHAHFDSALDHIRVVGSPKIQLCANDILDVLNLEFHRIDLSRYPADFRAFYNKWKTTQDEGIAYGWEAVVSKEERLSIIVAARLYEHLLQLISEDLSES